MVGYKNFFIIGVGTAVKKVMPNSGQAIWERPYSSSPFIFENIGYSIFYNMPYYAFDLDTGQELARVDNWSKEFPELRSLLGRWTQNVKVYEHFIIIPIGVSKKVLQDFLIITSLIGYIRI